MKSKKLYVCNNGHVLSTCTLKLTPSTPYIDHPVNSCSICKLEQLTVVNKVLDEAKYKALLKK